MIEINAIQGSPDWHAARLGHLTASTATDLLTPRLTLSSKREATIHKLLAEIFMGEVYDSFGGNRATERGHEFEGEALAAYEFITGRSWRSVGFCRHSGLRWVGASPDGLVDDTGGCEVKCPENPAIHLGYLFGGDVPGRHMHQVQFSLWVTGRDWWDFVSYYPGLPLACFRTVRDLEFSDAYSEHVPVFVAELEDGIARIRDEYGMEPVVTLGDAS